MSTPRPGSRRTQNARTAAAQAIRDRVAAHDAEVLPTIREYRRQGHGYRAIARLLDLAHDPPGRRSAKGDETHYPPGSWTTGAVRRICERHGLARQIADVPDVGMTSPPVVLDEE